MVPPRRPGRPWPGGLVGTYALHLMQSGPIYGGQLTQRIDERTRGAWRPGAGAIYPILTSLVRQGLARSRREGTRRVYELTPRGRAHLLEVQARIRERRGRFAELRGLILDMVDPAERGDVVLEQLRGALRTVVAAGQSATLVPDPRRRARTIARARSELRIALSELDSISIGGRR